MKKRLLSIFIALSVLLVPAFSWGWWDDEEDDYSCDNSCYSDWSEDDFSEMSDNELMEFLDSLSDEELYELLIEMGMDEDEFYDMLNEGYEDEYYEEDDSWSWWDDDDYSYEEEDEDSMWWWDDDEEDYDYEDDWGWGDEDDGYYYEDDDSYGGQYQGNPNQGFSNIKDETVGNGNQSNGYDDYSNNSGSYNSYTPSSELGGRVVEEALVYTGIPTYYATGGQDMARGIKRIDCSGLVINCYKNALKGTDYTLPFNDTTAYNLFAQYSTPTDNPEPGDLIFMSYDSYVDHVGIFTEIRGNEIYFIDATLNQYNKSGQSVNVRHYPIGDYRVSGFGKMTIVER